MYLVVFLVSCAITCCKCKREVWGWTSSSVATETIAQLQNESWSGIMNGLYAFCGVSFQVNSNNSSSVSIAVDSEAYKNCTKIQSVCQSLNISFHVCLGGIPQAAIDNPQQVIDSAIETAQKYNWDGYNIDDETECAPRADLANFTNYVNFINTFSNALHSNNIIVTADVQALFGIENISYIQNYPCLYDPWEYPTNKKLVELLANSSIDRWIEMDTYYFTLSRYLDALDWYTKYIPIDKLGIGLENRDDIEIPDGYVSRFHALWDANVDLISIFILPISDNFLMYLRRWKTYCQNCPQTTLSCFEPSVSC